MEEEVRLGVFDIDGTIFRSSLVIALLDGLVEARIFPPRAHREIWADYRAWLDRKGDYERYIRRVTDIYIRYINNIRVNDVQRIAHRVITREKFRTYRFTRDLIHRLKRKKFTLVAISGSPQFIVEEFAKQWGFDKAYGSRFVERNGRFTHTEENIDSWNKKDKLLKEEAKRENWLVDWRASFAVGDTETDMPVLSLVGNPIAFNPNRTLAQHARLKGWRIVVERKDVMYDIKKFTFAN